MGTEIRAASQGSGIFCEHRSSRFSEGKISCLPWSHEDGWPFPAAWYFSTKLMVIKKQGLMPLVWCRDRGLTTDLYHVRFPRSSLISWNCNNWCAKSYFSASQSYSVSFVSSKSTFFFCLATMSWIPTEFLICQRCILWNVSSFLFCSSLSLLFSVCEGSKLNWVMISWRYTTVPICSRLWLDRLMALKFHSSSSVAVTSFICCSPLITVVQTVASRYSMKVRICYYFLFTSTCCYLLCWVAATEKIWIIGVWSCQMHKAKGFIWCCMHVGAARMVLSESVLINCFAGVSQRCQGSVFVPVHLWL